MVEETDIPILNDLIEKGIEIKLSELGLNHSPLLEKQPNLPIQSDNLALEQEIRRILDEHMELAWQEIREAIKHNSAIAPADGIVYPEE
jgi:hypothetical protein